LPCYKLGIRFGQMDIIKRFLKSDRTGFYFAVTTEGEVGAGEMLLINPGERHTYRADVDTSAYLVFAGLPGVRSRTWTLRRKA